MPATSHLGQLLDLFYQDPAVLGSFEVVEAHSMPTAYAGLLAHCEHMTVTVESFHGCPVTVEILEAHWEPPIYLRKILLRRQTDGQVVQFGLVRLDTSFLPSDAKQAILDGKVPLGRVLIEHNVLREVHLSKLFRVSCGPELADYFGVALGTETYGRTARIHFHQQPALKLLEIVTPLGIGTKN